MREFWGYYPEVSLWLPDWDARVGDGIRQYELRNVHSAEQCFGQVCIIHRPTPHHMREWYLHWRSDRGIWERICPDHGTGHPDPDQIPYWEALDQIWQAVHGCCGCCRR